VIYMYSYLKPTLSSLKESKKRFADSTRNVLSRINLSLDTID